MPRPHQIRSNWAGNYRYQAPVLHEPRSIEQLQDLVSVTPTLSALGTRHSFNDIADSADAQVSVASLPYRFDINPVSKTVTVAAGIRYGEFVPALHRAGFALHNLASLPHITVGGAIATGTHGSGDQNGSLATAVAGLEFVASDARLRTVARGDDDFDGMVVSLGALGIVTAVTLDIEPAFDVRQDLFENLSWPNLFEHLDEIMASAYSVSLFTNWAECAATSLWLKSRLDGQLDPSTGAAGEPTFFGATAARRALHPLPNGPAANTTQQLGVPGPWHDRLPHFRLEFTPSSGDEMQTEYLVPREHARDAIRAIRRCEPLIGPHLLVSEIRTIASDRLWMSPSYGRDSLGLHFTWKNDAAVYELLPVIDAALAPFDARPHWAKVFATHAARLATSYPRLDDFRMLADRLDPIGRFRNSFLDRTVFTAEGTAGLPSGSAQHP